MALTLTELQAVTDAYYVDKTATDIYFKANVLLYMLLGGETGSNLIDGGKTINVPIEYGKLPGGSFDASTTFTNTKGEVVNVAEFPWAAYYASIVYDLDDKRNNNGDAAVVNLIETKIRNAQKTVRDYMATGVYGSATTAGKDMLGLGDLFNTTTTTPYGGIAEADVAEWKANVDATSEAISFKVMQKIRRMATVDSNSEGRPNLYITTELLKDGFERSLQANQRYSSGKLVEAGFDNILFGGAPVVCDDKVAAGNCYALNTNFLDVKTHRDYNFTKPVWMNNPDTPETQIAHIKWSGQLVCKNRKAHALHTGLTEPA